MNKNRDGPLRQQLLEVTERWHDFLAQILPSARSSPTIRAPHHHGRILSHGPIGC